MASGLSVFSVFLYSRRGESREGGHVVRDTGVQGQMEKLKNYTRLLTTIRCCGRVNAVGERTANAKEAA